MCVSVCVCSSYTESIESFISFCDSLRIFWTRCFICASLSHYFQHYHHQNVLRPTHPRPVGNNAPAIEQWKINQPMSMLIKTWYIYQSKTVVNSAATCSKACENAREGRGVQGVNLLTLSLSLSLPSLIPIHRIYYAFFIWQFFASSTSSRPFKSDRIKSIALRSASLPNTHAHSRTHMLCV